MKALIIIGALALTCTACATPDPEREAGIRNEIDAQLEVAEEEGLICEYRQVFGSLRRVRTCITAEEAERNADAARRQTERMQRSTPAPVSGD